MKSFIDLHNQNTFLKINNKNIWKLQYWFDKMQGLKMMIPQIYVENIEGCRQKLRKNSNLSYIFIFFCEILSQWKTLNERLKNNIKEKTWNHCFLLDELQDLRSKITSVMQSLNNKKKLSTKKKQYNLKKWRKNNVWFWFRFNVIFF